MHKELKKLTKSLQEQGYTFRVTRRQHLQVKCDGVVVTTFAGTPSDTRSFRNSMAPLRRTGFVTTEIR